ncbi:MAG: hypothetical protein PWQ57_2395 [Desulfovibrionales bacterium]|jgi:hypothetical protein|nr:hypothetical protein [Desulfovibrionales bacterium]
MLVIAGANEFLPPGAPPASDAKARGMAQIFSRMGYDLGLLTPEEAGMFDMLHTGPGPAFKSPRAPEAAMFPLGSNETAAVVMFPALPPGEKQPSLAMIDAVDQAVSEVSSKATIVAGLSPWGYFNEKDYLNQARNPVDVLLGSGPGLALSGKVAAGGRTVWVRPYSRGKTLMKIEVLQWPDRSRGFQWSKESVRVVSDPLDDKVRPDPETATILATTPQE